MCQSEVVMSYGQEREGWNIRREYIVFPIMCKTIVDSLVNIVFVVG